jgi:hypothetical protein
MCRFKKGTIMKVTDKADMPGVCASCGRPIYVGDIIIRYQHLKEPPVAVHADCDPDFAHVRF